MATLSDRCFCCFTDAMLVPLRRAPTRCLHTKLYKFRWNSFPNNAGPEWKTPQILILAKSFVYQSYTWFLTQFIEWLRFLFSMQTNSLWMSWTCLKPSYLLPSTGFSLGPFHFPSKRVFLSKFLAAFPLLVKKRNTIHNCFFCCWQGRHIGSWPNDRDAVVSGVIRDAWSLTKTEKPLVSITKTENQMLKNKKSANLNEHQNRKTGVLWHKNRKTDLKQIAKTAKPKIPMPPS